MIKRRHQDQNQDIRMERSGKARFRPTYKIMRAIKVSSVVLAAVTQLKSDQKHRIAMELVSIGASNRHNHEQSPLKPAARAPTRSRTGSLRQHKQVQQPHEDHHEGHEIKPFAETTSPE